MRQIAIIADIHGGFDELKCIIEHSKQFCVMDYIILGDVICGGQKPSETMQLLYSIPTISWIRGNTDDWFLFDEVEQEARKRGNDEVIDQMKRILSKEDITFLRQKPISELIELGGFKIMCCHGSPESNIEWHGQFTERHTDIKFDYDLLVCGHTHIPTLYEHEGTIVFNPGSAGKVNDRNQLSYGLIEIGDGQLKFTHCYIEYHKSE